MIRLGVLGWPVAHSRSPAMHNAALAELGLHDWTYQLLPVPPEPFGETVRALPELGFRGVNVTIPHKEAALALADEATERAEAVGAANTLTFADGRILADNTDAPGVVAALPEPPAGRRALVLGAGGSARGVVWGLRDAGATEVLVWNRTPERARRLARELGARAVERAEPADLLVNCTAAGLHETGDDPFKDLPLSADDLPGYSCVMDLVYGSRDTALIAAARRRGVTVVDGLEVLVRQGALSFARWTGRPAPVDAMRAAAREPARA
jgi:shikimate dehydrogenase